MTASTLTCDEVDPEYSYSRPIIIPGMRRGCPHDILWFSVFNYCRCLHNPLVDNHRSPPAPASAAVSKTVHRNILIVPALMSHSGGGNMSAVVRGSLIAATQALVTGDELRM